MMHDQHHLQRSISYRCPKSNRVKQFHLVPFAGECSQVSNKSFSHEDRKLLLIIRDGKPFVISDKDYIRHAASTGKSISEIQVSLLRWQLKIVIQALTYCQLDPAFMKMLAFGEEVERLTHLAAVLCTSGIASCKLESINLVNQKQSYMIKAANHVPRRVTKVVVSVSALPGFKDEYMTETSYW